MDGRELNEEIGDGINFGCCCFAGKAWYERFVVSGLRLVLPALLLLQFRCADGLV